MKISFITSNNTRMHAHAHAHTHTQLNKILKKQERNITSVGYEATVILSGHPSFRCGKRWYNSSVKNGMKGLIKRRPLCKQVYLNCIG